MSEMFMVVSRYAPLSGKQPIVHTWGPYINRKLANNAKGRHKRATLRQAQEDMGMTEAQANATISYHVCMVLGENGQPWQGQVMTE